MCILDAFCTQWNAKITHKDMSLNNMYPGGGGSGVPGAGPGGVPGTNGFVYPYSMHHLMYPSHPGELQ